MNPRTKPPRHWTTRRGFIAAAGFGGVGLYGVWVGYGAAPGPLSLLGLGHGSGAAGPAGDVADAVHAGGHGADAPAGAHAGAGDAEAFRAETERFIADYRLSDGTVHPRRLATAADDGGHAAHHAPSPAEAAPGAAGKAAAQRGPIDVPMIAGRWYYLPAALRLDVGQPYRFRLMTMDIAHGASIQFGRGARMLRLRPGRVTEVDLRFERPGRLSMICTVYCGPAHERMSATIEVA